MTRDDRGTMTRERLFMALLHEMGASGYEKASISRIVGRARSSKGAFYHHFKSKDDLLRRGLESHMRKSRNYVANPKADPNATPEDRLCSDIDRIFDEFEGLHVVRGFVELKLAAAKDAEMAELFRPDEDGKLGILVELIRAGQKAKAYRAGIDPIQAAESLYSAIFGAYYVVLCRSSTRTLAELAAAAQRNVRFFFDSIRWQA